MESHSLDILQGIVERITFQSEETGWSVLKVRPFRSSELIAVTLHQVQVFAGATCDFKGQWVDHPKFGRQFKALEVIEKKPATTQALEKYLGSGLIKGVGPKTAKKIVAYFKEDTLKVFDQEISRLLQVEGIARKKLQAISESWIEHQHIKEVMLFLQGHGISTLFAIKIFKTYGDKAIEKVKANPYQLAEDIWGIGFHSADKVAKALGIEEKSPLRLRASISHILSQAREDGHCYLEYDQIINGVEKLLQLQGLEEKLNHCLIELIDEKLVLLRVHENKKLYYYPTLYYAEEYVAKWMRDRSKESIIVDSNRVSSWIERYNQAQPFPLSKEQAKAVLDFSSCKVAILTGGPGCGKTTTTKTIVKLLKAQKKKVMLAAPTGRASQRMEEVIGLPAMTLHRLLKYGPKGFTHNEDNPLDCDALILDECSMLDISLTQALLKAVAPHTILLLIGDPDQLPSVGPGLVLQDLIQSQKITTLSLTQVFRQKEESLIIKYAHEINKGECPQIPSPLEKPELWKTSTDCMMIDSQVATQEDLKFIQRVKNLDLGLLDHDPEGTENIKNESQSLTDQSQAQNSVQDDFKIPSKYRHVDLNKVIAAQNSLEEFKEILKKIPPYSSLKWGLDAEAMLIKLYTDTLQKYSKGEVQILTPMTRGSMGSQNLNKVIQNVFNPTSSHKAELKSGDRIYRVGDRVIQRKNNYDLNVFNGDIGEVIQARAIDMILVVKFQSQVVEYKRENLIELDLAYAITIHKSQGSEFDNVIIPIFSQHFKMLFRNLIYTGLTRAKKRAIFLGQKSSLFMACKQVSTSNRQTMLCELLKSGI